MSRTSNRRFPTSQAVALLMSVGALFCSAPDHAFAQPGTLNHYGLPSSATIATPWDAFTIHSPNPFQAARISNSPGVDVDYGLPVGFVVRPDIDPALTTIFPAGVSFLTYPLPNRIETPVFMGSNAFVQVALDAWTFTLPQNIFAAGLGVEGAVTFWFIGVDIYAQVRVYQFVTDNCT